MQGTLPPADGLPLGSFPELRVQPGDQRGASDPRPVYGHTES